MTQVSRRNFLRISALSSGSILLGKQLWAKNETSQMTDKIPVKQPPAKRQKLPLLNFPNYHLDEIRFSMAGSFLTIFPRANSSTGRLQLSTTRKKAVSYKNSDFWAHDFYEIALFDKEQELSYQTEAWPYVLKLQSSKGTVNLSFIDTETLLLESQGPAIRLIPMQDFQWAYFRANNEICLYQDASKSTHQIKNIGGELYLQKQKESGDFFLCHENADNKQLVLRISDYEKEWERNLPDMKNTIQQRQKEVDRWMRKTPEVMPVYQKTAEMAWFILWQAQVEAVGNYSRRTVLMAKNWMNQVWAWDNCFNAIALVDADPQLAWNQLFLFFDQQAPTGMLPDHINDLESSYGFMKPPIYGWAIKKLVDKTGRQEAMPYIKQAYEPVVRLTNWWYKFRDSDNDGMCQYNHGNDSGWDNATVFDDCTPCETPDLAAYLCLQCEMLATMADWLGKKDEAQKWTEKKQTQLDNLLRQAFRDDHFWSTVNNTRMVDGSDSLLNYIPIILGKRLPEEIRQVLVKDLQVGGKFLTDYGLATEAIQSPDYNPDGYWRGPIWAPSTYLIFDGLLNAGEKKLAQTIAQRFCDMCVKEPVMWENYNALTGEGLRAPAYTWTASVFLLLAQWLTSAK